MAKVPNFLKKAFDKQQDVVNTLKPLKHIESMQNRIKEANSKLEELRLEVNSIKNHKSRIYKDFEVYEVLNSGLNSKGGMAHVKLAIKLDMNYHSLIGFLKQKEFCNGGAWFYTQDRVMVHICGDNYERLEALREENKRLHKEWVEKNKVS